MSTARKIPTLEGSGVESEIVVTQEFKRKVSEILRKNSIKSKSSFVYTERQ